MTSALEAARQAEEPPPDRLRLLVALHEAELGGATRAVLRVVPRLAELGWDVSFWVPVPGRAEQALRDAGYVHGGAPRLLRYGLRSLRVPPGAVRRLASVPGYLAAFRRFVREQRPDVVHANTLITIPEAVVARRMGCPTILHVHEMLARSVRGAAAAKIVRASVTTAVAPSAATAAALARGGVQAKVIPNGVDIPPAPPHRGAGRRPVVVGTLGTISFRKGSDLFVEAAREVGVVLGPSDVEFRMIGPVAPEPEREWAERILERARAVDVRVGVRDDVPAELTEWDVLVMPSREDPFPLAVLEGMASGLPIVATSVDGIPEQVLPDAGVLVPSGDARALAAEILGLVRDGDRRAALGAAARRRVGAELTLELQARRLDRVYREAVTSASMS